jgi:ribosomal protein L7/L12
LIQELQDYVATRRAIYYNQIVWITKENFDLDAANRAAQFYDAGSIYCWGDVSCAAVYLSKHMGRKINAIKFVRDCFKERPSLLEAKNWVEAL